MAAFVKANVILPLSLVLNSESRFWQNYCWATAEEHRLEGSCRKFSVVADVVELVDLEGYFEVNRSYLWMLLERVSGN